MATGCRAEGMTCIEAGAVRATTSGLPMLAGRISGDSTNWELPHRNGRNLPKASDVLGTCAACIVVVVCMCVVVGECKLVVVEAPYAVASGGFEKVTAMRNK